MRTKQPWLTCYVSDELFNAVVATSEGMGISRNKVVREAIAQGLELAKYKLALKTVMDDKLKFGSL